MTTAAPGAAGPVAGTARAVREGQWSAVAAVQLALERLTAHPELTCTTELRGDLALQEAAALDARLAAGEPPGPLAGVPVLVKDLEDVAGMVTRAGSALFTAAAPADGDAWPVARLREAGAVVVGKSTLPELATEGFTDSIACGPTRNPWSLEHSPGGSSGGSAAALAAGLVPVATATDGGGSVRIPAAFCGLLGLKPTHGVLGRWPAADWLDLSTSGPLATEAGDLRLLLRVMAGVAPGDPDSAPAGALSLDHGRPTPRVGRILAAARTSDLGDLPVEVGARHAAGVEALAQLWGVPVEWHEPGSVFAGLGVPDDDWFTLATAEHVAALAQTLGSRARVAEAVHTPGLLHPATVTFLDRGLAVGIEPYLAARRRRPLAVRRLDELLAPDAAGAVGVLVTPTVAHDAWLADGRLGPGGRVGALPARVYSTAVQNLTGHPALSLPWGHDTHGVPSGLQVTAPRWRDDVLLDLAEAWQAAHPWARTAPGCPPWVPGGPTDPPPAPGTAARGAHPGS